MSTTDIDLTPFCYPDGDARFAIHSPFVRKSVKYATDGRMLIAIPTADPDSPDSHEDGTRIRYPDCAKIFDMYDRVTTWNDLPAAPGCEACAGEGRMICPKCKGHGEHKCVCGCEHDCEWCDEKDNKVTCECFAKCGKLRVATWILNRMSALPGVQWGVPEKNKHQIIFVKFACGRGAMMPLESKP